MIIWASLSSISGFSDFFSLLIDSFLALCSMNSCGISFFLSPFSLAALSKTVPVSGSYFSATIVAIDSSLLTGLIDAKLSFLSN
jgi:hypothetical protein